MNEDIFAGKEEIYEIARPGYPREAIGYMLQFVPRYSTVADIGCGTGKLAFELQLAECEVLGVEPNAEMRKIAEARLGSCAFCGAANFTSVDGTAEQTNLPSGIADLVTVAQALHWFDIERFRSECVRILKPQGKVFVLYNKFSGAFAEKYKDFFKRKMPRVQGSWRRRFYS